jgi:hypothetical protein
VDAQALALHFEGHARPVKTKFPALHAAQCDDSLALQRSEELGVLWSFALGRRTVELDRRLVAFVDQLVLESVWLTSTQQTELITTSLRRRRPWMSRSGRLDAGR